MRKQHSLTVIRFSSAQLEASLHASSLLWRYNPRLLSQEAVQLRLNESSGKSTQTSYRPIVIRFASLNMIYLLFPEIYT